MKAALTSLLLANAGVAALVGNRINWNIFPQAIGSPALRLTRIGGAVGFHMQGIDGLDGAQVQIDVRAVAPDGNDAGGFATADTAAIAVKAALNGFRGTVAGTSFGGIFLTADRAYADKPDSQLFHIVSLDFDIWSRAAA